jgi:hypothetical protein
MKPVFSKDPMADFLHFLLYETDNSLRNIVYSHNGGRYDNIILAGKAYDLPEIHMKPIAQGNKLFNFIIRRSKRKRFFFYLLDKKSKAKITRTELRDSVNLIPLKLSEMVKSFGLKDKNGKDLEEKGSFKTIFASF